MQISLIWAMAENRVIGRGNTLPWRLPTDMRHFMRSTMGKPVLMGRKTFESMKAALPGRTNIVVTSDQNYARTGAVVVGSMEEGFARAADQCLIDGQDEMFVAGGARVYAEALPRADRLYVTDVHAEIEGDTYFPEFDRDAWRVVQAQSYPADERHSASFTISILERA